jgi:hypothetical protein
MLTRYEAMNIQDLKQMRKTLLTLAVESTGNKRYLLIQELNEVKQVLVSKTGDQRWR